MREYDFIAWDDDDDPRGNVQQIADSGVTRDEVEDVLDSPAAIDDVSRSTGRPVRFGWTSTGKFLIVIYEIEDSDGFRVLYPISSYEVEPR